VEDAETNADTVTALVKLKEKINVRQTMRATER